MIKINDHGQSRDWPIGAPQPITPYLNFHAWTLLWIFNHSNGHKDPLLKGINGTATPLVAASLRFILGIFAPLSSFLYSFVSFNFSLSVGIIFIPILTHSFPDLVPISIRLFIVHSFIFWVILYSYTFNFLIHSHIHVHILLYTFDLIVKVDLWFLTSFISTFIIVNLPIIRSFTFTITFPSFIKFTIFILFILWLSLK